MRETLLSSSVTVAEYRRLEANTDRDGIADFVSERFAERYIAPLRGSTKHGFCTMAISCLMIEALESFWHGWPDTCGRSREAFESFFGRCADQESPLGLLAGLSDDFYHGVRCGILHQAETTNGWRIHRKGLVFDALAKTINATEFHYEIENALRRYVETLKNSDWESEVWVNLRRKMAAVIDNCRRP